MYRRAIVSQRVVKNMETITDGLHDVVRVDDRMSCFGCDRLVKSFPGWRGLYTSRGPLFSVVCASRG